MSEEVFCLCRSRKFGKVNVDHPMRCIKTGAETEVVYNNIEAYDYEKHCDIFQCPYCGATIAKM
jgi:hypothetical protein